MKSVLLIAIYALATVCAAPQPLFVSDYENDGTVIEQTRGRLTLVDRLREDKRFSRFVEVLEKERGLRDDLEWASNRDENKPSMRDTLRYHIAGDCLHAGALIPTNLRLKSLEDRHQRIRVFRFHSEVWLEKPLTVFTPSNRPWESLGWENLKYLFSCVGQKMPSKSDSWISAGSEMAQCEGIKTFNSSLKYHVATKLVYSTDLMEQKDTGLQTLEGKQIDVCAGHHEGREDTDKKKQWDVRIYSFIMNKGEARIMAIDLLASNGVAEIIDNVMLPSTVSLPHERYQ
ncbi:hypothetical protein PhCBS80983_g02526 [Powellomyces hirtus]|uniref:FAS1 domain-containing protein n=1 Tax=Powellomyces hirtus TaxID=109895 RepID=A0A507E884_9FUNG|nr:hypothetical protein PhCBS80983_g02526 [Powellomyces hirtus]